MSRQAPSGQSPAPGWAIQKPADRIAWGAAWRAVPAAFAAHLAATAAWTLFRPDELAIWADTGLLALLTFPLRVLAWSTFAFYMVVPYGLLGLPWLIGVWTLFRGAPRRWGDRLAVVAALPVSWWLLAVALGSLLALRVRPIALAPRDVMAYLIVAPVVFAIVCLALPGAQAPGIAASPDKAATAGTAARFALFVALMVAVGIGLPLSTGRGPGLVLGAAAIAGYVLVRGRRIPTLGYLVLIAGLLFTTLLWFVVTIATGP